jgi:hypothetical protein
VAGTNFPLPALRRMTSTSYHIRLRTEDGTVARHTRAWPGSEGLVALTRGPCGPGPVAEP